MTLKLTREADLAAAWGLTVHQFRTLRRRNTWAHVRLSRQDVRYTDAQIDQIVRDMTARDAGTRQPDDSGLTGRSAARAS